MKLKILFLTLILQLEKLYNTHHPTNPQTLKRQVYFLTMLQLISPEYYIAIVLFSPYHHIRFKRIQEPELGLCHVSRGNKCYTCMRFVNMGTMQC